MTTPVSPQPPFTVRAFTQQFSSTPLGARLARRVTAQQLDGWGMPHGGPLADAVLAVVAELAANAVTHGRVPGRDFELRLRLSERTLRVEVSDTRGERWLPLPGNLVEPREAAESGRGLLMVEALADRWSVEQRSPLGKTVRAEFTLGRFRSVAG